MATILFAWEMGRGNGYARRLVEIARAAAAAGHRPVFAFRELELGQPLIPDPRWPVLQAPFVTTRLPAGVQRLVPASFADVLGVNGFDSVERLLPATAAWDALIDLVQPAAVVSEYSPILCMAAEGRLPVIQIGTGYNLPPADAAEFPAFRTLIPPYFDQSALLDVARQVAAARGRPPSATLTAPFATRGRLLYALPELDVYRASRGDPCIGPFSAGPPRAAAAVRVHAYLQPDSGEGMAGAEALAAFGGPATAYLPRCPRDVAARLAAAGVDAAIGGGLDERVAAASVVLHHAGIDTAQAALLAGRPQVVLPRQLDQIFNADALVRLGVAIRAAPANVLEALRESSGLEDRAREVADDLRRRGPWRPAQACLAAIDGSL